MPSNLLCERMSCGELPSTKAAFGGCPHPELCPLNRIGAGKMARIRRLSGPPEVSHRLRELGFCEDQSVRLLSQEANVICQVCNARLGISAELAETILVEPVTAGV
jgi:Fe2+ transport system protein FeoA